MNDIAIRRQQIRTQDEALTDTASWRGGGVVSTTSQSESRELAGSEASTASDVATAFLGTYPPRLCGIATFTQDLAMAVTGTSASRRPPTILAVTEPGARYAYPIEVKHELRQGTKGDYTRAAELVNYSDVQLLSVQHEYGIFGGDDGSHILELLTPLRVPAIVTLHTVLMHPSALQRRVVQQMGKLCARLVVMSQVAKHLLASAYGVPGERVDIIRHGIPTMPTSDQQALKAHFGVAGRRMLLTFGLLSPNKGIETVIRALPELVASFPDLVYFVVGATHPMVLRRDGEAYRTLLESEVDRLGLREHVVFCDQFVSRSELCNYLQATDVFVTPYLNECQVTSGALSYAMGAGAAAVSTPYWHAQELLKDGRGRLFGFRDHAALARTLQELLGSEVELHKVRSAAREYTRTMRWPDVGARYRELAVRALEEAGLRSSVRKVPRASTLPELRLDHLRRMTDDTGLIQHATYTVPARHTGYCVDDNARALIVALRADRLKRSPDTLRLVTTYLSYLQYAQRPDGRFENFMTYNRSLPDGLNNCSDDCLGRALWALGETVSLARDAGFRKLARDVFMRALPPACSLGPRGTALAVLGVTSLMAVEPESAELGSALDTLTASLLRSYERELTDDWHWFESTLTYDNALLPLALFRSHAVTHARRTLHVARESIDFLESVCFDGNRLQLVGSTGWHSRGGPKAEVDEQPIDAAAFVLAFRGALEATHELHYLRRMRESFAWFMGQNRLGLPLYDTATAGCRDGLGPTHVNLNEGAESTVCFLMALIAMLEQSDPHAGADGSADT